MNFHCGKPPATLTSIERDRLIKLCNLLGSNHDGERASAARMADRQVRGLGLSWDDVISPVTAEAPPSPASWQSLCAAILASGRATAWETAFAENLLRSWRGPEVTAKQRRALENIFETCVTK